LDKIWNIAKPSKKAAMFAKDVKLSPITAQILINREIDTLEKAKRFFSPELKLLDDPFNLADMAGVVKRIQKAIKNKEKICIYGDYDVDGITSTVLLTQVIKEQGGQVDYYIPCRFKEGYSLNKTALKRLKDNGTSLVITVDCGVSNKAEIEYAKKIGLEVIITDHHLPPKELPDTLVVNPKRVDSSYRFKELAGVGVAYQVAKALTSDELVSYLDLVCLGSVADIVSLVEENRALVSKGIEVIRDSARLGLSALIKAAGVNQQEISSGQIGFAIAPRLNAGGRMESALKSAGLLLCDDQAKADEIAADLDKINRDRQKIEQQMLEEVLAQVEAEVDLDKEKVIVLASPNYHDGVKGIVASRVVENYFRPTILCCLKDGKAKGSGRSIPAFNLHSALTKSKDLLNRFGGHAAAAGVDLDEANIADFRRQLNELAAKELREDDLKPKVRVDCKVNFSDLTMSLADEIKSLAPCGMGNPSPVLCVENVYLKEQSLLGQDKKHVKFNMCQDQKNISAIIFNSAQAQEIATETRPANIAFALEQNLYQGTVNLQARVTDIKFRSPNYQNKDELINHLFATAEEIIDDDDYKHIVEVDSFYTKVAGVTFDGRQEVIANVESGTKLQVIREKFNKHDTNAIRIDTVDGDNLGFLNARLAKKLASHIDEGQKYLGQVSEVTGGQDKNYGVNIFMYKEKVKKIVTKKEKQSSSLHAYKGQKLFDEIKRLLLGDIPLRDKQIESLEALKKGQNCLTIMGTGRGKSAIFHIFSCLQAIEHKKLTIMLYPLRSLITDQYLYLQEMMEKAGLNVAKLTGEVDAGQRKEIFSAIEGGQVNVILTTPEFLFHNKMHFQQHKDKIGFLVVDEAHHVCTSSRTHRPIYRQIDKLLPDLGNPLVFAATATASDKVADVICNSLSINKVIIDPTVRENLKVTDKRGLNDKESYLRSLVSSLEKTVIYVNSRKESVELAAKLHKVPGLDKQVVYFNAGMGPELRLAVQKGFFAGDFKVVVATSAFGEGVNIPDIKNVVLYHLPFNFIEYNQQSGRAGRDGNEAIIHLMFGRRDASINEFILESACPSRKNLTKIYRVLQRLTKSTDTIIMTNEELLKEVEEDFGSVKLSKNAISAGLKIFSELGLIQMQGGFGQREITLLNSKKVDLNESIAFEEGMHEKEQFADFKDYILSASPDELLELINQPIYPQDRVEEEVTIV